MSDLPELNTKATVVMVVKNQAITIEVNGVDAPITAGNFVDLVERGIYDGVSFHRVVRSPQPFVVQGGDPRSKDPNFPANLLGTGNFIDPATNQARFIPLEIKPQGASQPIYSQTFQQAGITQPPQLPNVRGSIAMARSQALDSASSQFYFNLANSAFLDGNYAVFGTVTSGFELVDQMQQGDRITAAKVTQGIIPTRTSSLITSTELLNSLINTVNAANISLPFADATNADDDVELITEIEVIQTAPSGVRGLDGNDRLIGTNFNDVVNGNQGNDTLTGEGGDDYLRGGRDNDLINGNLGNDILNGNFGDDTVNGGAGDDFIRGGQGNDLLTGGDGNDYLVGDFGADTLVGSSGADTFILRVDTAQANQSSADRIVDLTATEGDRIGVVGNINRFDLSFIASGSDVVIQLGSNILGVVQNSTIAITESATFVTGTDDAAVRIG